MIDTFVYYLLGVIGGLVVIVVYNNVRNINVLPMSWKKKLDSIEIEESEILKDRYSSKKLEKEYDYIIVGSGISGMGCASLLAKLGHRVLVLE